MDGLLAAACVRTASGHRLPPRREARFPLIPNKETGVIRPVAEADIDEMSASDDLPERTRTLACRIVWLILQTRFQPPDSNGLVL